MHNALRRLRWLVCARDVTTARAQLPPTHHCRRDRRDARPRIHAVGQRSRRQNQAIVAVPRATRKWWCMSRLRLRGDLTMSILESLAKADGPDQRRSAVWAVRPKFGFVLIERGRRGCHVTLRSGKATKKSPRVMPVPQATKRTVAVGRIFFGTACPFHEYLPHLVKMRRCTATPSGRTVELSPRARGS